MTSPESKAQAKAKILDRLMELRHPEGHWEGELSTSALSTAVAVCALSLVSPSHANLVDGGVGWLVGHQNPDGGYGDTVKSKSNISTTLLVLASFYISKSQQAHAGTIDRIRGWLVAKYGQTTAQ